jgi:hypothetical protein
MNSLNPLAPVTDYQSMLNRIFWFTSASALVAVWMLRQHNAGLNSLLNQIDLQVELSSDKTLPIPGGFLFPALAIGMLTRVFRLHARISDWLGIRETFDIEVIMREFAIDLDLDVTSLDYEQLAENRHRIMRSTFYAFVSGSHPAVDEKLLHQALDAWSWFWVGVEATLVFTLAGSGLVAGGARAPGLETVGAAAALAAFGLPAMRRQCARYAVAQVRAIGDDPARAAAVREVFAGLSPARYAVRRAA